MFEVWEKITAFEPNKNVKTLKIKPQHSRHAIMAMFSIWKPGIAFFKRAILFTSARYMHYVRQYTALFFPKTNETRLSGSQTQQSFGF
jgi:hypothetical protein